MAFCCSRRPGSGRRCPVRACRSGRDARVYSHAPRKHVESIGDVFSGLPKPSLHVIDMSARYATDCQGNIARCCRSLESTCHVAWSAEPWGAPTRADNAHSLTFYLPGVAFTLTQLPVSSWLQRMPCSVENSTAQLIRPLAPATLTAYQLSSCSTRSWASTLGNRRRGSPGPGRASTSRICSPDKFSTMSNSTMTVLEPCHGRCSTQQATAGLAS